MNLKPGDKLNNLHDVRRFESEVVVQKDMTLLQTKGILRSNLSFTWSSVDKWVEHLQRTQTLGRIIHIPVVIESVKINITTTQNTQNAQSIQSIQSIQNELGDSSIQIIIS